MKLVILLHAKITSRRQVPDSHGMQPVNEAARPFRSGELQSPQRSRLTHYATAFVNYQTVKTMNKNNKPILPHFPLRLFQAFVGFLFISKRKTSLHQGARRLISKLTSDWALDSK